MKTFTTAQKEKITADAVVDLLRACGPCGMSEIVREVKEQAFISSLPAVMWELQQKFIVSYDQEFEAYELVQ